MEGLTEIEKLFLNVSDVSAEDEDETAPCPGETSEHNTSVEGTTGPVVQENQEWIASTKKEMWNLAFAEAPQEAHSAEVSCPVHGSGFALSTQNQDHMYHKDTKDFQNVSETFMKPVEVKVERHEECHQSTSSRWQTLKRDHEGNLKIEPEPVKIEMEVMKKEIEVMNKECMLCDKKFTCLESLEDYVTEIGTSSVKCTECSVDFPSKSEALLHSYQQHNGGIVIQVQKDIFYSCPICSYNHVTKSRSFAHMQKHPNLIETCPREKCGWMFTDDARLRQHDTMYHRSAKKPKTHVHRTNLQKKYVCPKCFGIATTKKDFEAKIPSLKTIKYKCTKCAECFNSKLAKTNHFRVVHQNIAAITERGIFTCRKCSRKFDYSHILKKHMMKHKSLKHKCKKCGWFYKTPAELKRHQSTHSLRGTVQVKSTPASSSNHHAIPETDVPVNVGDQESQPDGVQGENSESAFRSKRLKVLHQRALTKGKMYQCKHCPRCFVYSTEFEVHKAEHKADHNYKCSYPNCNRKFNQYHQLHYHTRQVHAQPPRCPRCCCQLSKGKEYDSHIGTCDKPFECINCSSTFISNDDLVIHNGTCPAVARQHQPCQKAHDATNKVKTINVKNVDAPQQTCVVCEITFKSLENVNDYVVQGNGCGDFRCRECLREFKSKGDLLCHAYFDHTGCVVVYAKNKNSKAFKCFLCGRRMKHKTDLEEHIKKHEHLEFRCSVGSCSAMFSSLKEVQSHRSSVHPNVSKHAFTRKYVGVGQERVVCPKCIAKASWNLPSRGRWKCPECTERFHCKFQKHQHMQSAHKFTCGKCGMAFRNEQTLHLHMESVHAWACYKCGIEFRNELSLDVHVKKEHPTKKINPQIQCEICDEGFYSQTSLKVHMRSHDEELKCTQCGKRLSTYGDLRQHKNSVHDMLVF